MNYAVVLEPNEPRQPSVLKLAEKVRLLLPNQSIKTKIIK